MKLLDIIEEQESNNVANAAYGAVVRAVAGIGTNLSGFMAGMNMLRNARDFQIFMGLFKDKKTGYGSFIEMMNDEFDRQDMTTIQKVRKKLLSIGIDTSFNWAYNRLGDILYDSGFRVIPKSTVQACGNYEKLLPRAIKYWKDWLLSPVTKKKFNQNWGYNPLINADSIFKKYLEALDGIVIEYYNKQSPNAIKSAYAYVNQLNPAKIFVNCDARDPKPLDTLVHEIQHTLYNIHPLNPEKKIGSLFVNDKTKREKVTDFFTDLALSTVSPLLAIGKEVYDSSKEYNTPNGVTGTSLKVNFEEVSKRTGIESEDLKWWSDTATKYNKEKHGYVCDETEKMSNIMAIRKYFNLKPGQDVTYKMLKSEMEAKRPHTDVHWLILCWALNGFQDINGLLNKMNSLAYQETGSDNTNNLAQ